MPQTTASNVTRHSVVRFTPEGRSRRVTVLVDTTTTTGSLVMVHGVRCTSDGCIDSQAQRHAWPIRPDATVEVVA